MGIKYRGLMGLLVLVSTAILVSCGSSSSTTPPDPGTTGTGFLFVTTQGDNKISPFTIDLTTGKLTTNGTGLDTGSFPAAAVITPAGDAIFVVNRDSKDISRYTIKADGTLTAVTPTQATGGGDNPVGVAMDAAGKFLFVVNQGTFGSPQLSTISVFSIGQGAALTPVAQDNAQFSTHLNDTVAIAVTPDGKFLYAANRTDSTIIGYSVDANGLLTLLPGGPVDAGTTPVALTITPDDPANPSSNGVFLYVANSGSDNISVFSICDKATLTCVTPNGDIKEITGSPFSAGLEPTSLVIANPKVTTPPSGTFLYVADHGSNQVSQFTVASVSGSLTTISPPAISTGQTPVWVAARSDGHYVYAANNGGSSISPYHIADTKTGVLGTIGGSTGTTATGGQPSAIVLK
jgi:6-phosphogluconolactonase (cycloisomerase 2 family)